MHAIFTDAWRFYKGHCEPTNDEAWWKATIKEMKTVIRSHGEDPMCMALMFAILNTSGDSGKDAQR